MRAHLGIKTWKAFEQKVEKYCESDIKHRFLIIRITLKKCVVKKCSKVFVIFKMLTLSGLQKLQSRLYFKSSCGILGKVFNQQ